MMLPASLLSAAALAMPRTSAPSNATAHGAPEYMGAGAFAQDFHEMTFGASVTASGGTPMQLHMMPDKGLKGAGAVCLDGSDAGFYFAPATNPKNKNDWQLYFQGGGWCYDEEDCWGRSNTGLGSSAKWAKTSSMGGVMSDDCTSNPDFCNFNRVHMVYCDGNSFSGNRDAPVVVKGMDGKEKPIYFRGRRIIDAILATLVSDHGLADANNVLLTGCSAGGLATYLHTDYVHTQLTTLAPKMAKFKASAISGFFLLHNTVENKPVYPNEMANIFKLANSTHGVNAACIAATPVADQWKCNFAQEAYKYTAAPTFPLNSALDSWQTGCIYTSELDAGFPNQHDTNNGVCSSAPGWAKCAGNPESCSAAQMVTMNKYIADFQSIMTSTDTYKKAGNGAFVHSCHTHCEAQGGSWNKFAIDGQTMQQKMSAWWNAPVTDPSAKHVTVPCQYKTTSPHKCNPTC